MRIIILSMLIIISQQSIFSNEIRFADVSINSNQIVDAAFNQHNDMTILSFTNYYSKTNGGILSKN